MFKDKKKSTHSNKRHTMSQLSYELLQCHSPSYGNRWCPKSISALILNTLLPDGTNRCLIAKMSFFKKKKESWKKFPMSVASMSR